MRIIGSDCVYKVVKSFVGSDQLAYEKKITLNYKHLGVRMHTHTYLFLSQFRVERKTRRKLCNVERHFFLFLFSSFIMMIERLRWESNVSGTRFVHVFVNFIKTNELTGDQKTFL